MTGEKGSYYQHKLHSECKSCCTQPDFSGIKLQGVLLLLRRKYGLIAGYYPFSKANFTNLGGGSNNENLFTATASLFINRKAKGKLHTSFILCYRLLNTSQMITNPSLLFEVLKNHNFKGMELFWYSGHLHHRLLLKCRI